MIEPSNAQLEAMAALGMDGGKAGDRAKREMAIRSRFPNLGDTVVELCVDQGLTDDEISGALYMMRQRQRNHRQAMAASRNWLPPSAGYRKSAKSKRQGKRR